MRISKKTLRYAYELKTNKLNDHIISTAVVNKTPVLSKRDTFTVYLDTNTHTLFSAIQIVYT